MKFGRERRLTERPDFLRCYETGRRFFSSGFVLFAAKRGDGGRLWRLGLAVTKKTGSAVWRNRVRRLVRECFRLEQEQVPGGYDYVVVPKRGLAPRTLNLDLVREDLLPLLRSLAKKTGKSATGEGCRT